MRWWTRDCLRLSMIGAAAADAVPEAETDARASAGEAPFEARVKPWKKARHVGSTELGSWSQDS
jgi:hypothetical protein